MNAMHISQIILVVVLFLAFIVKGIENSELANELEFAREEIKKNRNAFASVQILSSIKDIEIGRKDTEIAKLKKELLAYEELHQEPYKEKEENNHDN